MDALKRTATFTLAATLPGMMLLAAKCGDDDESLKFSTKVSAENMCDEVAEVMCSNIFECCRGEQIETDLGVEITTSEKDCRRDVALACEEETAIVRDSVAKGRSAWKVDKIDACLTAALAPEDGCFPLVTEVLPQCVGAMYEGKQPVLADCLYNFECISDAYCGRNRKCAAYPTIGQSCEADGICATVAFCSSEDTDGDEIDDSMICVARKMAGAGCNSDGECVENLICVENENAVVTEGEESFYGLCTAKKGIGEICTADQICASGNCLPGMCSDGQGECYTNDDCGGSCETYGYDCVTAADCPGQCENSTASCSETNPCAGTCVISEYTCYDDGDCVGTCMASEYSCTDNSDCDIYLTGDTCQLDTCAPGTCVPEACEGASSCGGMPVCAESYYTMNYCSLNLIQTILGGATQTEQPYPLDD